MMRFLVIALILQVASANAVSGTSLTWQKLALEEKVQRKFNTTLSTILKDNQYLVEVETEISEPPAPNFGDNGHKSGPRVSDIKLEESRGDYIAFSKIGLEVPVVEKFLDEDRTRLMNLYRFNESYDLFKNISDIKVTVLLSDKLPTDLVEIVKKLLQSSRLSVSGIKPSMKFETIPMEWIDPATLKKQETTNLQKTKKVQEEPKIWTKDWYEWASRWGNAVGLIIGALIIGLIALSLFKQWKNFMENYAAKVAKQNDEKEKEPEGENKAVAMAAPAGLPSQEEEVAISQGFERFQQCLEHHPEEAINILRSWLNQGEENDLLALRGVAQLATAEQMEKLMNGLSELQRDQWKSQLGKHLEKAELDKANKHIFYEVIKSFLVPSRIKDGELLNLIMELNTSTTCDFFNAQKDQVGILMNILSPAVIGKILANVEDQKADSWLNDGADFPMKNMEEKLPGLKEALIKFKEAHAPSPFAHRIMSMIPSATPSREMNLFRALAKSGSMDMVLETARKNFPCELVLDLPSPVLKESLQSYPMSKRVELILSRPEDIRSILLDTFAETGTPARDMINLELENVSRDASKVAMIESRSEEIWQEFVKVTRIGLSKNASYKVYTEQLIKEWSQKLKVGLQAIKGGKAA